MQAVCLFKATSCQKRCTGNRTLMLRKRPRECGVPYCCELRCTFPKRVGKERSRKLTRYVKSKIKTLLSMKKYRRIWIMSLLAASLFVTGCGEDDESEPQAGVMEKVYTLSALDNSGVSGTVAF